MPRIDTDYDGYVSFQCPGCGQDHCLPVTGPKPWQFNGNAERPTLYPSILATGLKVKLGPDGKWNGEWERGADGKPLPNVCHSFVTDGRIQFLTDSNHALAGQTVDLPEVEA
jgi:hypothetical protein